ncbi:RND transporter [Thermotoga sp. RQ7]|uniref:efflux RND transporter permease subunit n=1 Tax=Thermotoga sp. RQ7 TaxID=126738 RepID=UPI0005A32AC0|nr:RND family transporter [Thermotoga sp. RQ7]AJG41366.1 RND transporter [Thermotoga sp. RQ7]
MFEEYTSFVFKNRKKIFAVVLVLNILALFGLFGLHFTTEFSILMPQKSRQKEIYEKMNGVFKTGEQLVVMVKTNVDPLSREGIDEIFEIKEKLSSVEGVKTVIPPIPEKFPAGFRLVETKNMSEEQYRDFLSYVENMKDFLNVRKMEDGYYSLFMILPRNSVNPNEIESTLSGYEHYLSGTQYLEDQIFRYLLFMIFTLPPLAVVLLLNVFRVQLGRFRYAILSLIPAGFAALWTLGYVMGWMGQNLSIITVLVPIFTIVMGSADGLHFVSHFLERKKDGESTFNAIKDTLESVGRAMILTTLTTMAGFLSFLTLNSQSMKQMGLLAAAGIGLAGVSTWIVLPVILSGMEDVEIKKKESSLARLFQRLSKRAWIITLVVLFAFLPGTFLLKADLNILKLYKSYTKVRKNVEKIEEIFGRALPVYAVFESENLLSPDFARKVLSMEEKLKSKGYDAFSVYDILVKMNEHLFKEEGYPKILARALILKRLLPEEYTNNFLSESTGRAFIFLDNLDRNTLEEVEHIVKESGFQVTGLPYIIKEMNDSIVHQQVLSVVLAVSMVFLLLVLFQRSFVIPAKAIVPVLISLVSLFGFMGLSGIPLNLITANMAGIVIGVGIDYAIHVTELFRYYRDLEKTVKIASTPVLANAFGLSVGLSALILSPFTFHTYLVAIMWVTMTVSSFMSLVVLPKLLEVKR